jgi:hypothetical protein
LIETEKIMLDNIGFLAAAMIGTQKLSNQDILNDELARSRHALTYLKQKIGNDAMRELLRDDLLTMTARMRDWVKASAGAWQTGAVELIVPGPSASGFRQWYANAMSESWEVELRAGHPEHFINHPVSDSIEVIENVGETELPWHIFYRRLAEEAEVPSAWDQRFPVHFAAEIVDAEVTRVGYSMRELRDDKDGLHMKLTSHLPAAAPPELLQRHLHHFSIEYRNWASFALKKVQLPVRTPTTTY